MNVEELTSFALQRVTAYEGMVIDPAIWTDAHAYHQTAQRLHTRVLHGWGVVAGLQVLPTNPAGRAVLVQPGVAIDRDGNVIRVPQPVRLPVPPSASGAVCIVLRFAETPVESGGGQSSRVSEFFNLLALPPSTRPNDIEIGRVAIVDAATIVRAATDEWSPAAGEIDYRFRRQLYLPGADTLTVGQVTLTEGAAGLHRRGLVNLVRELRATAPYVVQFLGDVRLEQAVGLCDLLYVTGAGPVRMTPREGAQLAAFVRGGGVVFAEPCAEQETQRQENGRFVATFTRLMADLKHELSPIGPGHPLFDARYVFGAPPEGAAGHAALLGAGQCILNPNDYGCCWGGGSANKPLARETIRGTMEFGANIGWYAADQAAQRALQAVQG